VSETNAITNDTVIIRAAGGPEITWRTQRMVSLGADAALAAKIAHSDVDVQRHRATAEGRLPAQAGLDDHAASRRTAGSRAGADESVRKALT
jgi:hypothetical protein